MLIMSLTLIIRNTWMSLWAKVKEVQYSWSAHCSAHLFIIAISSHSHAERKQPQRIFLQRNCSVTMINIVKKYIWRKIHDRILWWFLNRPWSDLVMILSHKHGINILYKITCCRITTGGCFRSSLSSAYKTSIFPENNPVPSYLFSLKILSMERSSDSQS